MLVSRLTLEELFLLPVILLVIMACVFYLGGTFAGSGNSRKTWGALALGIYLLAAAALAGRYWAKWLRLGELTQFDPTGPLSVELFGQSIAWLAILTGAIFTAIAMYQAPRETCTEYFASLMVVTAGIMLVGAANDLVLLFTALEMVSIPTYILLYLGRRDRATSEATAKYFFLSIFASALLLYGMSFLYGIGGVTLIAGGDIDGQSIEGLRELLAAPTAAGEVDFKPLLPVALVLIFAGLGFKIAAAPFHFYAPDVYQGLTNANAGLLAIAPKIAGMAALVKLGFLAVSAMGADFAWQLALVVAVLSMTIGNVCALWQQNLRRLMAYSSIAHSGYLLIGLAVAAAGSAVGQPILGGISAVIFYLFVYLLATAGVFCALSFLSNAEHEVSGLKELSGLGRKRPLVAAALAICLFSLTGIPPLAGFWGKFSLFNSAIGAAMTDHSTLPTWMTILAAVGAINAAVAAAYYLRVVAVLYFGEPQPTTATVETTEGGAGARGAMAFCAIMVLVMGAFPGRFFRQADLAERSLTPAVQTHLFAGERSPKNR